MQQCPNLESNQDLLLFRQTLVPHELSGHGACDEDRTRQISRDRGVSTPVDLAGIR